MKNFLITDSMRRNLDKVISTMPAIGEHNNQVWDDAYQAVKDYAAASERIRRIDPAVAAQPIVV